MRKRFALLPAVNLSEYVILCELYQSKVHFRSFFFIISFFLLKTRMIITEFLFIYKLSCVNENLAFRSR